MTKEVELIEKHVLGFSKKNYVGDSIISEVNVHLVGASKEEIQDQLLFIISKQAELSPK